MSAFLALLRGHATPAGRSSSNRSAAVAVAPANTQQRQASQPQDAQDDATSASAKVAELAAWTDRRCSDDADDDAVPPMPAPALAVQETTHQPAQEPLVEVEQPHGDQTTVAVPSPPSRSQQLSRSASLESTAHTGVDTRASPSTHLRGLSPPPLPEGMYDEREAAAAVIPDAEAIAVRLDLFAPEAPAATSLNQPEKGALRAEDGDSSASATRSKLCPSSTPHAVRSLTGGAHQLARGSLNKSRRADLPIERANAPTLVSASSDEQEATRFDVAPALPNDFLQEPDARSMHGARSAAAMQSLIDQEKPLDAVSSSSSAAPSLPQSLPLPLPSASPSTSASSSSALQPSLSRFLRSELGAAIFASHLTNGGVFLKHGNSVPIAAAAAPTSSGTSSASSASSSASSGSSSPHWRSVWVSPDLKTVYWGELNHPRSKRVPSGALLVEHVLVLFTGHQTRAFTDRYGTSNGEAESPSQLLPGARFCAPSQCFSLITPSRTLDLEAVSQHEAHLWITAFQWLLQRSCAAGPAPKGQTTASASAVPSVPQLPSSAPGSSGPSRSSSSSSSGANSDALSRLSLVSALEILSDLVALGPGHAALDYFAAGGTPPAPVAAAGGQATAVPDFPAMASEAGVSAASSAQTSQQGTPQHFARRISQTSMSTSMALHDASSAASSVGSTPAFGSPQQSVRSIVAPLAASNSGSPPLVAAVAPAPVQGMPLLSLDEQQQHPAGAKASQATSSSSSALLSLPSSMLPTEGRTRSTSNLAPLPETEEELLGSGRVGSASVTANTAREQTNQLQQQPLAPSPNSDAPFYPMLQPASHEPELHSTMAAAPAAPMLQPQPLPSLTPLPPLDGAALTQVENLTMAKDDSIFQPAPQQQQAQFPMATKANRDAAIPPAIDLAALEATPAQQQQQLQPASRRRSSATSPRADLERERARLERLLDRERREHAHLRVWVAHRFLHLQSHINSLCIERAKLQRRAQAEAEEAEREHEREIARVFGATPNTTHRRLTEMRCHSSEQ